MEYLSQSEEETYRIAEKLAKHSQGGDVFAFSGDLGSGKTAFTKGFARALGVEETITSPTFVILKAYKLGQSGIDCFVHVDCYRLSGIEDVEAIGLKEYLGRDDAIVAIEWPEKVKSILPPQTTWLTFSYINENTRKIMIEGPGAK